MRVSLAVIFLLSGLFASAQDLFQYNDFLNMVRTNHPMAIAARLEENKAEAEVRKARGAFDPQVYGSLDQKYYDGKTYYSLLETGLKMPTWFGIEGKVGSEWNSGTFINPENRTPAGGLGFAGLSMPLGKGLFIDERRANLKQALLLRDAAPLEIQSELNVLLADASIAYWEWSLYHYEFEIYQQGFEVAKRRFEMVKELFRQGERPAMDTVEALIILQFRQGEMEAARLSLENARLKAGTFCWKEGLIPLDLKSSAIPDKPKLDRINTLNADSLEKIAGSLLVSHPDLLLYQNSLSRLNIERKLKAEYLKPQLNVNYNLLSGAPTDPMAYFKNNYKFGVEAKMPIFLRVERGNLQLTKIKQFETELKLDQKSLELTNKLKYYHFSANNYLQQADIYSSYSTQYKTLLDAEELKFQNGQSSLFLLNSRETKWLEAREKYLEIQVKYLIALVGFNATQGNFGL